MCDHLGSLATIAGSPCLGFELERQPVSNTLAFDLYQRAGLTTNARATVPVARAGVLHRYLLGAILNDEATAFGSAVTKLDQFAAGTDAYLPAG